MHKHVRASLDLITALALIVGTIALVLVVGSLLTSSGDVFGFLRRVNYWLILPIVLIVFGYTLLFPCFGMREEHCFLVDEGTGQAEKAPPGFYWRSSDGWFKKNGKRLIHLSPFSDRLSLVINKDLGLGVYIRLYGWEAPNEEVAMKAYALFLALDRVQGKSREEIERALVPFTGCAAIYNLPK